MKHNILLPIILIGSFLISCTSDSKKSGTPALFNTQAEAEKAAKDFNCSGAHKMGEKWMPCEKHENHNSHKN